MVQISSITQPLTSRPPWNRRRKSIAAISCAWVAISACVLWIGIAPFNGELAYTAGYHVGVESNIWGLSAALSQQLGHVASARPVNRRGFAGFRYETGSINESFASGVWNYTQIRIPSWAFLSTGLVALLYLSKTFRAHSGRGFPL